MVARKGLLAGVLLVIGLPAGCARDGPGISAEPFLKENVERVDLIELQDEWLYVLDRDSGLNVFNVSNPAAPVFHARMAEAAGEAVQMHVHGHRVYMMYASTAGECSALPGLDPGWNPDGWTDVGIAAAVPEAPWLSSRTCVPGELRGSSKQGDNLYLVTESGRTFWIFSIDINDPVNPRIEDLAHGTGTSRERRRVHAAFGVLYVASDTGGSAMITYWDISDSGGTIVERDTIEIPKSAGSRVYMDEHGDHLSVVAHRGADGTYLHEVDVRNPGRLAPAGRISYMGSGALTWDVSFEEDLVFITTYFQHPSVNTDTLWIVSREDPPWLSLLSNIQIPSWSHGATHVGNHLIAIGRGDGGRSVKVSLHDVSNISNPEWIDTEEFALVEGPTGWHLDIQAAQVMQRGELGDPPLVIVPYTEFLWDGYECIPERHFQLVDARWGGIRMRGDWTPLEQHGRIEDILQVGNRVYAISDVSVTTLAVSSRDAPREQVSMGLGHGSGLQECDLVRHRFQDVENEVVSFFEVGCSVAGPGQESPGHHLILAALLVLLACSRRRRGSLRQAQGDGD